MGRPSKKERPIRRYHDQDDSYRFLQTNTPAYADAFASQSNEEADSETICTRFGKATGSVDRRYKDFMYGTRPIVK